MSENTSKQKAQAQEAIDLPKITKQFKPPIEIPSFTRNDVNKIIEHIIKKGKKYNEFKNSLDIFSSSHIDQKISSSSYVQFVVRKELTKMGDQRRLGTGLRGFSKLLLQQFQLKAWPMIQIEAAILLKQKQEKLQHDRLDKLLSQASDTLRA